MVIIYERLENGTYQFLRLNFDSGAYSIVKLYTGKSVWKYITTFQRLGYTFIHR